MARTSKPGRRPLARNARKPRRKYNRANGGKIVALKTSTVPDRTILRMKYVDNIVLAGIGGSTRVFRMNSIYDPDTSVTNGHQPLGFDQWASFYNKYRVFKAVVTLRCANASSNSADSEQIGFCAHNDQVTPPQSDAFFEQPHAKKMLIGGRGGMDRGTLRYTVDLPRVLGMAPVVYKSNPDVASPFNTSPVEQVFGTIFARPIDGSSTTLVNCEITIEYFCELFDRSAVSLSYPAGKDPDAPGATDGKLEDL